MSTTWDPTPTSADHADDMAAYAAAAEQQAAALGNRGPLRFDAEGRLTPDILAAYDEHGFYVFERVIDEAEFLELRSAVEEVVDRAPVRPRAAVDAQGRSALGCHAVEPFVLVKPLSDPWGGTDRRRHRRR